MDSKIEDELNRLGNKVNKYNKTKSGFNFLNMTILKCVIPFVVLLAIFIILKPSFIVNKKRKIKWNKLIIYMFILLGITYTALFYKHIPYLNTFISKYITK